MYAAVSALEGCCSKPAADRRSPAPGGRARAADAAVAVNRAAAQRPRARPALGRGRHRGPRAAGRPRAGREPGAPRLPAPREAPCSLSVSAGLALPGLSVLARPMARVSSSCGRPEAAWARRTASCRRRWARGRRSRACRRPRRRSRARRCSWALTRRRRRPSTRSPLSPSRRVAWPSARGVRNVYLTWGLDAGDRRTRNGLALNGLARPYIARVSGGRRVRRAAVGRWQPQLSHAA